MYSHADKIQKNESQSMANPVSQKQKNRVSTFQFVDNRQETVTQRKLQEVANYSSQAVQLKTVQEKMQGSENVIQKAAVGTINCPNLGTAQAIGNRIHGILEADYIANGNPAVGHPTWVRGGEHATGTGQIPDISLRTPAMNTVRSVGEIKPQGQQVAGTAQIGVHLANIPANGLNAVQPVINDPAWAAGATFPVVNVEPGAMSPSGNVNVWQHPGTPGLYLYNG